MEINQFELIPVIIIILLFIYRELFLKKKISIYNNGIEVKSMFSTSIIIWSDILSMSSYVGRKGGIYRLKTKSGSIGFAGWDIPNIGDVEKQIIDRANLEIYQQSSNITRWNKIGKNYVITGLADRIYGLGYWGKNHENIRQKILWIVLIMGLVAIGLALYAYYFILK